MSEPEDLLAFQMKAVGIPFQREHRFAPLRRWRADFHIPRKERTDPGRPTMPLHITSLLVEVDGGAFVGGRHVTGTGVEKDAEKQSAAAIAGYRVIRCTPRQVESGECLAWIEAAR